MKIDSTNMLHIVINNSYIFIIKWLDLHYHFIKDYIKKKDVILHYISGSMNMANMLTKPLIIN